MGWIEYKAGVLGRHQFRQDLGRIIIFGTSLPQGASFHQFTMQLALATNQVPPAPLANRADVLAPPILALRAARRAIAADPDHPDGYFALARALADRDLPITEPERSVGMVTAYRQCLARLPTPDEYRATFERYNRRAFSASPFQAAAELAGLYLGRNPADGRPRGTLINVFPLAQLAGDVNFEGGRRVQLPFLLSLNLAREAMVLAVAYAEVELSTAADPEKRKQLIDQLKAEQKSIEDRLRVERSRYEQEADAAGKVPNRFQIARRHHLTDEAIRVLKGADLGKEFGANVPNVALQLIALELSIGRLEDAARDVADLKEALDERAVKGDQSPMLAEQQGVLRHLELQKLILEGNYAVAGTTLDDLEAGNVGIDRMLAELTKLGFDPKPYGALQGYWPMVAMLGAMSPLEAYALFGGGSLQLGKYGYYRQELARKMADDVDFYFRRGFLSLLEGDMESAKARFHQATDKGTPPPPGWNLPPPRHATAASISRRYSAAERRQ
jgi:hypothetical protein